MDDYHRLTVNSMLKFREEMIEKDMAAVLAPRSVERAHMHPLHPLILLHMVPSGA